MNHQRLAILIALLIPCSFLSGMEQKATEDKTGDLVEEPSDTSPPHRHAHFMDLHPGDHPLTPRHCGHSMHSLDHSHDDHHDGSPRRSEAEREALLHTLNDLAHGVEKLGGEVGHIAENLGTTRIAGELAAPRTTLHDTLSLIAKRLRGQRHSEYGCVCGSFWFGCSRTDNVDD